jgi:hypothetical protein
MVELFVIGLKTLRFFWRNLCAAALRNAAGHVKSKKIAERKEKQAGARI